MKKYLLIPIIIFSALLIPTSIKGDKLPTSQHDELDSILTIKKFSLNKVCQSDFRVTTMIFDVTLFPCHSLVKHEALEEITLTFGGDVLMEHSLVEAMKHNGATYPFIHVNETLQKSDLAIINLETPVTDAKEPFPKKYNFKASPILLDGLKESGVDLVSLANNHTLDYLEKGLLDTITSLREQGIDFIGAGENSSEAYQAKYYQIKNKTIAFLGFSQVLPAISWYAGEQTPGIASGYQLNRVEQIVKETKQKADYVIIYFHWGDEKVSYPNNQQKLSARKAIDAGADAIIGSHSHVLQGFEYYKNKPIAYSLGNLLFPDYVSGKTADTGLLTLTIKDGDFQIAFEPFIIKNNQISPLSRTEKQMQLDYLQSISKNIKITTNGKIEQAQ